MECGSWSWMGWAGCCLLSPVRAHLAPWEHMLLTGSQQSSIWTLTDLMITSQKPFDLSGHHSLLSVQRVLCVHSQLFRNKSAKFTQSLLCSLFAKITAVIARMYIPFPGDCFQRMLLHSRVCWWLPTDANHRKQTYKLVWRKFAEQKVTFCSWLEHSAMLVW